MILTFQSILNLTDLYPDAPNSLSNCAGVVVQKCHGNQRKKMKQTLLYFASDRPYVNVRRKW